MGLEQADNAGSLPTYVLPPPPGLRDVDYCNQFEYETCVVRIALASCTPPTGLKMEVVMGPAAWGESDGASRVSQCRRAQSRTFNWTRLWTPPTCAATHDTYSHPHTSHHRLASARAPTTHTCPQGAGGRGGGGSLRVARSYHEPGGAETKGRCASACSIVRIRWRLRRSYHHLTPHPALPPSSTRGTWLGLGVRVRVGVRVRFGVGVGVRVYESQPRPGGLSR